eukprot:CAMPEP_0181127440 /NCGR_PEP_ID=MMETSP1071-20121207/28200_1 /TAXON_ID=35127 /ORGANISM="Thalassiosira sp., Strain NH16" /LENGTH=337 /DNA_ID=CAMNT_0023213181 /DNA_START=260 /DNA_END=1274 /DNA_ORIENTATION=-
MVSLGKYLRWLCVVSWISYQIYFIVHGLALLKNKEGEMAGIFTCDISDDIMGMMTECAGLDDITTCGAAGAQCVRSSCGRPLFPHIGVSFAGSSDPFDADSATSTESFVTSLSLLYSLVPYILLIYFSIYLLAFGNVVPLTRLGLMGFISLVNDALLKNLVKQPRPTGSCLYFHSYGMPSGHAATSIGLVTFMLLELLLYHPNLLGKENLTMSATCDVEDIEGGSSLDVNFLFTWGHGWHKRTIVTESNSLEINKISAENLGKVPTKEGHYSLHPDQYLKKIFQKKQCLPMAFTINRGDIISNRSGFTIILLFCGSSSYCLYHSVVSISMITLQCKF